MRGQEEECKDGEDLDQTRKQEEAQRDPSHPHPPPEKKKKKKTPLYPYNGGLIFP